MALQFVLPEVIFAPVKIWASAAECEQPVELKGRFTPRTMSNLLA
jgi:hypothetical protein